MRKPGRPRRASDRRLEQALRALGHAFDAIGVPWLVIGGVAVIARGVRRMTTDLDAVVPGAELDVSIALTKLRRHGFVARVDDAEAFARVNLVLLLRHRETGVDVDLSFGWTEFEAAAIASGTEAAFGEVRVPIARPADLVVFKAIAARPRDIEDATSLLLLYPDLDVVEIRRRVVELSSIAEAPELVAGLDAALEQRRAAQASGPQRARRSTRTPRRPARRN